MPSWSGSPNAVVRGALGSLDGSVSSEVEAMIIDLLRQEHRNIEKLLLVLERELSVFARGKRPDYEVVGAVIADFEVHPDAYHHPQEDLIFKKLEMRDPKAAASVGDLAAEHRSGAERLRRVAQALQGVLMDREIPRQIVDGIVGDFITHERHHMAMEERLFFPAVIKALQPDDWAEIAATLTDQKDPLFSEIVEERFEAVRKHILQLERG
jgi:hemerythrin-like domain-containing protein